MKNFTLILFLLTVMNVQSQNLKNGIYEGTKFPFTICYVTYKDSIIEVEYFAKKASTFFDRTPAVTLKIPGLPPPRNLLLVTKNDSLKVTFKEKYLVVRDKEIGKIKVYKSELTEADIANLRKKVDAFKKRR